MASVASLDNALKYEAFAKRAATGEFDDFASTYACPVTQLHGELTAAGLTKFAARVADGEFDASKEESDEWASSPEGPEAMAMNMQDNRWDKTRRTRAGLAMRRLCLSSLRK